ncbi:hypothetical protein M436DRAFT_65680 [Aureobasidium namibiae CBS 147.97]|uniref:Uncharacterized protein n=1 Tax=Aureobasidium namibiae CBS 147.97 TaxID=1043004 RepID=A0A074WM43_9PEZI
MCALGLNASSKKFFPQRAMTAERQRLIEEFPKTSCIEERDSIRAMWLYEMMELSDAEEDVNNHWRPLLRAKGLNLPILLKMTRRFCQSHPEATDSSAAMTTDAVMRYAPATSAWLT